MKVKKCKNTLLCGTLTLCLWGGFSQVRAASFENFAIEQQSNKVTGIVNDEFGPVIGASVVEKGTSNGVVTDLDGKFSLNVKPGATLIISFVGYKQQEVKAGNAPLNIVLEEDSKMLSEVVVTALGIKRERKALGYGVAEVQGEALTKAKETNVINSMAGRVPGLVVTQTAGGASGSSRVILRGSTEMTGNNQPLYVIDGVPLDNTNFGSAGTYGGFDLGDGISSVNPDDIEKIDILKDASSTAIYGSRATNGVVIVTTKRGKAGAPKVSYDGSVGFKNYMNAPDMMDGQQYVQLAREYSRATKGNGEYVSDDKIFSASELVAIENNNYMDWFDALTSTAWMNSHTLSVSGGTEKSSYVASAGYHNEDGCLQPQFYKRYNLRAAVDVTPNDYFKFGVSLYGTFSDQETGNEDGLQTIYRLRPTYHPTNLVTGEQEFKYGSGQFNPFVTQKNQSWRYKKYDVLSNLFVEFNPIKNLALRSTFSPDLQFIDYGMYAGAYTKRNQGSQATAWYEKTTILNWVWDNMVTYNFDLMKDHHFDLTGVYSMTEYQNEFMRGDGAGLSYNSLWYALQNGAKTNKTQSKYIKTSLMSYLARLNYNYKGKYYVTASMRYDGSSKLAEGHKWGGFFAGALAWRITEEEFMKDIDWLNNLKLRVSFGQSGNDNVGAYQTQGSISGAQYYSFGTNDVIGYVPNNLRNMELGWERTTEYNIGVDFGFLNNRISGSFEYYNRLTEDLIMNKTLPITLGYSSVKANVGSVRNKGFEFVLNTENIRTEDFSWRTSFNIAYNNNKIEKLQYIEDLTSRGKSFEGMKGDYSNLWVVGQPIDINYNLMTIGVWQLDEAEEAAKYGCKPGQYKVLDLDKNGKIDDADRVIDGKRTPDWTGGMVNTFNYKNFDLSVGTSFQLGGRMRNQFYVSYALENNNMNLNNMVKDYWTPENPTNESAQPGNMGTYRSKAGSWGNQKSDVSHTMSSSDFFKITHVSLGYTFDKKLISKSFLTNLRLYCTVQNPMIICADNVIVPEQLPTNVSSTDLMTRNVMFGVNVSF